MDQIDDPVGGFLVVRADGHKLGLANAGGLQHVLAGPIAIINAKAEFFCRPHPVGRTVNHRHVNAACKHHLGGDLTITGKADHEDV